MTKQQIQKLANSIARKHGYGTATDIIISSKVKEPKVTDHTSYGYRKYTTGEYVSNAYRRNFGWKNSYWQHAQTEVTLPISVLD